MDNPGNLTGLDILSKAGAVITALENAGEMPVAAIAAAVDEPVSSSYRLLSSLTALGWVEASPRRGVYRLGLVHMRIGGLVEDRIDVRAVALPELRMLRDSTGLTAFLCVPRQRRASCIERCEGTSVRSMRMRLGDSLPLYAGAAPLAILSYLPEAERKSALEEVYRDERPQLPTRTAVLAEVRATRARGYAVSRGDVTHGIAAIGAPVFNHRGELEAAISVSGLFSGVLDDETGIAQLVVDGADRVSTALGCAGSMR